MHLSGGALSEEPRPEFPATRRPEPTTTVVKHQFTEELQDRIIDLYIEGKSLAKIARELPECSSYGTIIKHAKHNPEFVKKLTNARALRALYHEEQMERHGMKGGKTMTEVASNRLKMETAERLAAYSDPETYGKRVQGGGSGGAVIQINVITGVPAPTEAQKPPVIDASGMIIRDKK